ncbi:DMT family transporter [Streptomyces sp. TR06-5]|uniref:DMT family transporter n=1 Tax=Streptomyces sp. TR06-5 TaxID=3385976 RepID=UPI0039A2EF4A
MTTPDAESRAGRNAEATEAPAESAPGSGDTPGTSVLALVAGVATVVMWASAFIGIRVAVDDLTPGALALARLLIGSIGLGTVVAFRRSRLPRRADMPRLLVCGVLLFGVYNVALNSAEQRIDAGTASMVIALGPVILAVLAGFLLKEGFPRPLLIGGALAFSGVLLIGLATSQEGLRASLGTLLALAAAAAYAGGVIAQKPLLRDNSALVITWLACLIGSVLCLPFLPQLLDGLAAADTTTIGWTLFLGIFPTAVAFTTWGYALARSTAGRTGALVYLSPPIAVCLAWLVLDEVPPWLAVVGGVLALAGVSFSRRSA